MSAIFPLPVNRKIVIYCKRQLRIICITLHEKEYSEANNVLSTSFLNSDNIIFFQSYMCLTEKVEITKLIYVRFYEKKKH